LQSYLKVISLLGVILLMSCDNTKVDLLNNLNQDSANTIVLVLGQNDISVSKVINKDGTYKIMVDKNQEISAISLLKYNGDPSESYAKLGEVFKKDGFISSPVEEQARFIDAKQQEISAMISAFNGVVYVNTQISLPPPTDNMWQSDSVKPSASVLIKYKPGYKMDVYTNRIRQMVANAVPGLVFDNVEVLPMQVDQLGN